MAVLVEFHSEKWITEPSLLLCILPSPAFVATQADIFAYTLFETQVCDGAMSPVGSHPLEAQSQGHQGGSIQMWKSLQLMWK